MDSIRKHIIVLTTWLSAIISIWLWLFHLIEWQGPVVFLILIMVVMLVEMAYKK